MQKNNPYLLTICIATHNRAEYLKNTLKEIIAQTQFYDDVEILIADGNSSDSTEFVAKELATPDSHITYLKLKEKGGVDKDYDLAVQNAKGKYCWLFTDDDSIKANVIRNIRKYLSGNSDLIIINSEICNYSLNQVLKKSALETKENISLNFEAPGRDIFFKLCGTYISFIGSIVIKKCLWMEHPRHNFYETRFIHVGVISTLKETTSILILSEPFIKIRLGNAEWSHISFKVWANLWPNLIWSIPRIEEATKKSICHKDPSKSLKFLFWLRGLGCYSKNEFITSIAPQSNALNKVLAAFIAYLPQTIPRSIYYIYGLVKRDQLLVYQVTKGRNSQNQWHSSE